MFDPGNAVVSKAVLPAQVSGLAGLMVQANSTVIANNEDGDGEKFRELWGHKLGASGLVQLGVWGQGVGGLGWLPWKSEAGPESS